MPKHDRLSSLDIIAVVVVLVCVGLLIDFPRRARTFAAMYRDFGTMPLPLPTQIALHAFTPLALALVAVALLARAWVRQSDLVSRRRYMVGAFCVSFFGLGLCVVGAELPIFQLAGSVK